MSIIRMDDIPKNGKIYNGNTRKYGITMDGKDYIVKFPKDQDLSVYCEYIASNLIWEMGFPCQRVLLGSVANVNVDIIEDFVSGTEFFLHSFRDTKQSSEDTDVGNKEYTYLDVLDMIEKHTKLLPQDKVQAKRQFWQMILCDAILANRDRHQGNWGYLSNHWYRPAPLYDNGACLFPGVGRVIRQYEEDPVPFLRDRVFTFPACLFRVRRESREHPDSIRPHRSNYYEICTHPEVDPIFAQEMEHLVQTLAPERLYNSSKQLIQDLPVEQSIKMFWISVISLRYAVIVRRESFETAYTTLVSWLKEDKYV